MKQRFFELWNELQAQNPENEYESLKQYYLKPKRYYHTLDHVQKTLNEFDCVKHLAMNPLAVELALWYHDAIYNPREKNNEEMSARLLYDLEKRAGINKDIVKDAYDLVLATKHDRTPFSFDEMIIMDCDLASLGKIAKEFEENGENIRKEYSHVPSKTFNNGRVNILKSFLEKPYIYHLSFFRENYERQARINLQRAIDELGRIVI